MGKTKAGEERKQATDYKEIDCCPSADLQRAARRKMVCMRRVLGMTGTLGKPFQPTPKRGGSASQCRGCY